VPDAAGVVTLVAAMRGEHVALLSGVAGTRLSGRNVSFPQAEAGEMRRLELARPMLDGDADLPR